MSGLKDKMEFTGERFVPEVSGNIVIEHLHRYLSAVELAKGKVVLDIASGEGYGSDLLSLHAAQVIGVDIAAEAVDHANAKYQRPNLTFRVGECAAIPCADNSIDLIVSFETLEHHDKHDETFREFKRVLRPGGQLLISSPDKKYYSDLRNFHNEFHVKELYEEEFHELMEKYFRNVNYFSQRICYGSLLLPTDGLSSARSYVLRSGELEAARGVTEPLYLLALASDGEIGTMETGLLEQPLNDTEVVQSWTKEVAWRDDELDRLRNLVAEIPKLQAGLEAEQLSREVSEQKYQAILASSSWKVTRPLRVVRRALGQAPRLSAHLRASRSRAVNALGYLRRGDVKGLLSRATYYRRQAKLEYIRSRLQQANGRVWGIMSTPHTLFIAQCIAERLERHGIATEIMTEAPRVFNHDLYIVLCAQMFERLPPGEKRVIFQLEQSVSSRWFTPAYLNALQNSLAVLEYATVNIEFLASKSIAYPHVNYLPIGTSLEPPAPVDPSQKEYDFIFYGDYYSSPRRSPMLDALKQHFSVKLCNDVFGDEMHQLIRKARAVINIHYYENALLEMPRIQECLSLGVPVLSESSQDQQDYPELGDAVRFFEQGSIEAMLEAAKAIIAEGDQIDVAVRKSAQASASRFTFMIDRFLANIGSLRMGKMLEGEIYLDSDGAQVVLSMPETIDRRQTFLAEKPKDCAIFDGIRNTKGWVGCGASYSALARYALAKGLPQLTVFEDDVLFHEGHEGKVEIIREYLAQTGRWDIFSGVIASVHPNTRVLGVEVWKGMMFVRLDHMTSTVFNIYNNRALNLLARWDPENTDVDSNAIDRYLENSDDLVIVVALPFLVGHREDVASTLWGFENDKYSKMIAQAEKTISDLAKRWLEGEKNAQTVKVDTYS
ncbi:methyltransferase domain-containing protein [Rhizobium lusitanum]|nr:methyltransferase domain-containing protein [Rhizobium lusitanum]